MAEIGRFFDGPAYGAHAHAEFYTNFLSTGFFWGLDVTANDTLEVTVASGAAFLEGHEYRNTESLNLEHNIADSVNDRIDRVVIRLDNTPEAERPLRALIRPGMPNSNPEPPELVRNDAIYEISLAQVLIEAGKSYIEQYQITDERGNPDLCGRVGLSSAVEDQITSVDVRGPDEPPSTHGERSSWFYIPSEDIMGEWLDSIGVSASDYGRSAGELRAYVETIATRNNTAIQTITIFDWSRSRDYRIYGVFKRAANSIEDGIWGSWHEEIFIFEEGETANGKYTRYSNGEQVCTFDGFNVSGTTNSIGSMYRSDSLVWNYPIDFDRDFPIQFSGSSTTSFRWVIQSGQPGSNGIPFRIMSALNDTPDGGISVYLEAKGRWRK